ncbi:glycosyltransferase family 4 protein [Enterococcus faecium]|nr:glycosyltransferase family 4 protein [Enterococcus faecium]
MVLGDNIFADHEETLKLTSNAMYVNNGIIVKNLAALIPAKPTKGTHRFTIFTMGRICHQKNSKLFNDSAKAMPELRFVWIGDGELKDELSSENIEITGWVDREEALKLAVDSDVFILTSLGEGLPVSLLEAMYMKKICVVSNVIGNRDVIHNEVNGYVCDGLDDLLKSMEIIRNNNQDSIIENAYQDVINEYNTEVMAETYLSIYKIRGGQQRNVNMLLYVLSITSYNQFCVMIGERWLQHDESTYRICI